MNRTSRNPNDKPYDLRSYQRGFQDAVHEGNYEIAKMQQINEDLKKALTKISDIKTGDGLAQRIALNALKDLTLTRPA